jgi:hypothetical protein
MGGLVPVRAGPGRPLLPKTRARPSATQHPAFQHTPVSDPAPSLPCAATRTIPAITTPLSIGRRHATCPFAY